jgi:tol-pal system protein YbgF
MIDARHLLLPLVALALGGCQLLEPRGDDPVLVKLDNLERRMEAIERVVRNQGLAGMTQQVSSLERQGDELRGQIEELEHNSTTTAERQRQLYLELDARIQELEAAMQARSAPNVLEGGTLSPGQLPVPGGSDRDNYQVAFELLKEQRYEDAGMAFEQFLVSFPESELADNAQYWLAESHYVTQKFEQALAEFEIVTTRFSRSRKVPDALLKMGYCNYELKQWEAARVSLERVQEEYPETTAARLAGQRLQRMDEESV